MPYMPVQRPYDFHIIDYLSDRHSCNRASYGTCRHCGKRVAWRYTTLVTHKVRKCDIPKEECARWRSIRDGNTTADPTATTTIVVPHVSAPTTDTNTTTTTNNNNNDSIQHPDATGEDETVRESCQARMELARFICRAAIPFSSAGCDEYKEMFHLINPLFVPPTPEQLRGPLLKRTIEELDKEIQSPSGSRSRFY
jgi:hypothetical protein